MPHNSYIPHFVYKGHGKMSNLVSWLFPFSLAAGQSMPCLPQKQQNCNSDPMLTEYGQPKITIRSNLLLQSRMWGLNQVSPEREQHSTKLKCKCLRHFTNFHKIMHVTIFQSKEFVCYILGHISRDTQIIRSGRN